MKLIKVEIIEDWKSDCKEYMSQWEWTRLTWEEMIKGKRYKCIKIIRTDTIDDDAEDIINSIQRLFDRIREEK